MSLAATTLAYVRRPVDELGNRAAPLQLDQGQELAGNEVVDDEHVACLAAAGVLADHSVVEPQSETPAKAVSGTKGKSG